MTISSITVSCPYCRSKQKFPYVYDGSYEVVCNNAACYYIGGQFMTSKVRRTFFILIRDGTLHVRGNKKDLERIANRMKKSK